MTVVELVTKINAQSDLAVTVKISSTDENLVKDVSKETRMDALQDLLLLGFSIVSTVSSTEKIEQKYSQYNYQLFRVITDTLLLAS